MSKKRVFKLEAGGYYYSVDKPTCVIPNNRVFKWLGSYPTYIEIREIKKPI